jgi:transposase InsO family protein
MATRAKPYIERVHIELAKRHRLDNAAIGLILHAARLLGLSFGVHLAQVRQNADRLIDREALIAELTLRLDQERRTSALLRARFTKLEPGTRPRYTPAQRFDILEIMKQYVLSAEETARSFVVSTTAIYRWLRELKYDPEAKTVGSLVKPHPPIRRIADDIRHLVQMLRAAGLDGPGMIARVLLRAGILISPTTARRIVKERPVKTTPPKPPVTEKPGPTVKARHPNHVWMMDISQFPAFFRILTFHVTAVIDVYSRMPLGVRVYLKEPTAEEMIDLVNDTIVKHGRPRHFVSDQGPQFRDGGFRANLRRQSIRQRYGAVGKTGSIAIIERCWRTLKGTGRFKTLPPLVPSDMQRRLDLALTWYAYLRPHLALDGATPAEVYFGIRPQHLSAAPAPRGLPRATLPDPPFEIAHLDREKMLPLLLPKAA